MAKKEVVIATREVAWSDGKVMKFQTSARQQVGKRVMCIQGDPKPTTAEAYASFVDEYETWRRFLSDVRDKAEL